MDDVSSCPTYHRILETSIRLVKAGGLAALTVRRVASEAGVNIAAVNYHFKSKENLIDAVVSELASPFLKQLEEVAHSSLPAREKLHALLTAYSLYFRSLSQSLVHSFTSNSSKIHNSGRLLEIKRFGIGEFKKIVSELIPGLDDTKAFVTTIQLFSAIALPALFPEQEQFLRAKVMGFTLPSLEEQINILLDNLLSSR